MKRKTTVLISGIALLVGVTVFLSGPRVPVDTALRPVTLPDNLDRFLTKKESRYHDITPGTEATIIWVDSLHDRTEFAIVYLHGFSATRRETAPLCDSVATLLHANLYYPRLTGHGRTGEALAAATVNDWCNDVNEAVAIGRRIGDRVILIGNSNGGSLATWITSRQQNDIAVLILISPNFGVRDKNAALLLTPWARYTIPLLIGRNAGFTPFNKEHERFWTSRYPTTALLPMMGLVKLARTCDPSTFTIPVMVIYSPNDRVLATDAIECFYEKLPPSERRRLLIPKAGNEECHVIAGAILSPETTLPIAREIAAFVRNTTADR